ncbi:actin-like ATPase domain-containing protein [Eremomyces bilateralis CBS 781.70]|uniref:Actin-like ATPase domain-containing protein n=1 Tax=Eremomyces bilateralis CBS 781.70 TaxID=1392243 RepID=A0A6G1FX54_9PEZI|nr:actin-like ATPase domain-containing protein [Eremomyces bilateralis CBS 781.70]KAF1810246.1 actin-like ATPase domain-containing protein [Eremomyces bilateralis CBS 781.70]
MSEEEAPDSRVCIGVSFGNSYSSIAYTAADGKTEVIANEDGDRQIPSILSYVSGEEFNGNQAKAQLVRNPENTVVCFRDFLGREFKDIDPTPCHTSAHPISQDSTIAFNICDDDSGNAHPVSISTITTRHLARLKASASDYLGRNVTHAVLTVPTNFTPAQQEALKACAAEAKISILHFIHEPISSLLAYDARSPDTASPSDKNVVVVDIGATRSDVTVVASRGGIYTILATQHDYDTAGTQLDSVLIDHFAKAFLQKHKTSTDPRTTPRSLAKMKLECENVKKHLSLSTSATFSVESLVSGLDFTLTINRSRYELLASKHFQALGRLVLAGVTKAGLDPLDVSEIVMAGGSSHTPRIASAIAALFPEETRVFSPATDNNAVNPSEAAARGAAIQASLIAEFEEKDIEESVHAVVTSTPHLEATVGLVGAGDSFLPVVLKDTPVPVRKTVTVAAPKDGGDVLVRIAEGERAIDVTVAEKVEKKTNGAKTDDEDSDEASESDDEPEEIRKVVWKATKPVAEAGVAGVKKGGKVEVQISVHADLTVHVQIREVGGKGGVRGTVEASS